MSAKSKTTKLFYSKFAKIHVHYKTETLYSTCTCIYYFPLLSLSRFLSLFSKLQAQFQSMEVRNSQFSAFIDVFTPNTYVMVIMSDPTIRKLN